MRFNRCVNASRGFPGESYDAARVLPSSGRVPASSCPLDRACVRRASRREDRREDRRSREKFRPHAARSCHFSPSFLPSPSPSPPIPPCPSPVHFSLGIRRAAPTSTSCAYMRFDRLYATAPRFSRVIVVDLHRVPGDGILGSLGIHHPRRRRPGKLRRWSCPPKGAGVPSLAAELEDGEEEEEEEEARHLHREGSRGRPAAATVNRRWRTTAKCERALLLFFAFLAAERRAEPFARQRAATLESI